MYGFDQSRKQIFKSFNKIQCAMFNVKYMYGI